MTPRTAGPDGTIGNSDDCPPPQPLAKRAYDLEVTLDYTNSPGGTITVTLGTGERYLGSFYLT